MPHEEDDEGQWVGGGDVSLDPVADRVRSVSLLLRELRQLPPESELLKEGVALVRAVVAGITPRDAFDPGTRH